MAWFIRLSKASKGVTLPPTSNAKDAGTPGTDKIVPWFDGILGLLMYRNKHICFYRSYGLAYLLRKRGLPVVMNVGGRGLGNKEAQKAHCWLTLG